MNSIQGRTMILAAAATAFVISATPALAQRADDATRPSKNGKVESTIDGVQVTIEYGRPNVNGRKVWGALVPYGQVWRTGANEATTITFDKAVKIGGKPLAAGTYGLFTLPGEHDWQFIFNKVAKQWGAFSYKESDDALRVPAKPSAADHVESVTFEVSGSKVVLRWEKLAVAFEVAAG